MTGYQIITQELENKTDVVKNGEYGDAVIKAYAVMFGAMIDAVNGTGSSEES